MYSKDIDELEIAPEEVEILVGREMHEIVVVDVREDWELVRGILPGASHVPLSKLNDHLDRWQPDRRYIVYCEHGIRSLDLVAWLVQNKGIDAKSMRGGFAVWQGTVETIDETS